MKPVSIGLIGIGNMGKGHVRDITASEYCTLAAVCDIDPERTKAPAAEFGVPEFTDYRKMMDETKCEAILIATPHYDHTPISIEALKRGVHVLVEKPVGVHGADVKKMIAAHEEAKKTHPGVVFAAMFMQRTYPYWRKIKQMIDSGELGRIIRTSWIITSWFRTQFYYDSGGWRATWAGEGGGVLLNQCPHNLDMYQWLVGMPKRIVGFAHIGKYHHIEVEDEVTAYFEHEDGMVGHFVTTTAESPGTNRLEIVGENGKLVFEDGDLVFFRNKQSMLDLLKTADSGFAKAEYEREPISYDDLGEGSHRHITENFAQVIRGEGQLIAPAAEGLNSVVMGNAIMHSSFHGVPVDIPMDDEAYAAELAERAAKSTFTKGAGAGGSGGKDEDMSKSFN